MRMVVDYAVYIYIFIFAGLLTYMHAKFSFYDLIN